MTAPRADSAIAGRSFFSIDIEPGGLDRPVGFIGLVEVVDGVLGEVEVHRFLRPDIPYSWDDWCGGQRAEAWQRWMRLTESQREDEMTPLHGGFNDEILAGLVDLPLNCMAEHHRPEPPPFRDIWGVLATRLEGRFIAAFGARYDRRALRELTSLACVDLPHLKWLDGMEAARHYQARDLEDDLEDPWLGFSIAAFADGDRVLGAEALRQGLLDLKTAGERWSLHTVYGVGNKPLAFDAGEDARLNALIFLRMLETVADIPTAIRTERLHVHEARGVSQ